MEMKVIFVKGYTPDEDSDLMDNVIMKPGKITVGKIPPGTVANVTDESELKHLLRHKIVEIEYDDSDEEEGED